MSRTAYYAHSVAIYDTEQEERDVSLISDIIDGPVYNPNNERDDLGYKHGGMDHFLDKIRFKDLLFFRANPDGSIPAGVAQEIAWAREFGIPVLELPSCIKRRTLSVDETREFLEQQGER
jgi:hypothetical protein